MTPSDHTISRQPSPGDITVKLRLRASALQEMVKGDGLPVHGTMHLVEEPDGAFAICIWSAEIPDWPDPVPGNAAAVAERERAEADR